MSIIIINLMMMLLACIKCQQQLMYVTWEDYDCVVVNPVTEALVLRPLLEDRGHITESVRILVPVDRMKQKCFHITTKRARRLQQFLLRR